MPIHQISVYHSLNTNRLPNNNPVFLKVPSTLHLISNYSSGMDEKQIEIMSQWFELCYNNEISLEIAATMGEKIINAYSSPHRSYHTLGHLHHCFAILDQIPYEIEEKNDIRFAIWFHDFIYDPKSESNEHQSAEIAYKWLHSLGVSNPEHVRSLIESTANYLEPAKDVLTYQVLHDIDLGILASDEKIYIEYSKGIREEYGHLNDKQFFLAREKFLNSLMELDSLFALEAFEHRWEEKARKNISKEIKKIKKL